MEKPTTALLHALRKVFLDLNTPSDLATLLNTPLTKLTALALKPSYNSFFVKKRNGNKRLIEDPDNRLQAVQDTLNDYLQAVYYPDRRPSAYGFIVVPQDDPTPRHIESNAERHIGKSYLLNADLLDYFHQITTERVQNLFEKKPFGFSPDLTDLLARLTTYKGRCPMGAPTSPVLSNLVFQPVDDALLELSARRNWTFTRYADDFSFSANTPLTEKEYQSVRNVVEDQGYIFNPDKVKYFGPQDVKIITGLQLGFFKVELPPEFIAQVKEDITQLKGALAVQWRVNPSNNRSTTRFQRSVEGKISFAERILGTHHPAVESLKDSLNEALEPPDELEARDWQDFFNY